jgi:hypothetical protein
MGKKQIHPTSLKVIRFISTSERYQSPRSIAKMTTAEVTQLKKIVSGHTVPAEPIRYHRAISVLARKEQSPQVCSILKKVIADPEVDSSSRAVAASKMVLFPQAKAEAALIENLDVRDSLVQSKVIKSLGCIGGRRGLDRLNTVPTPKEEFVQKQLVFSKALIAYRLGLDTDDLPFKQGVERIPGPADNLITLSLRKLRKPTIVKNLKRFTGSNYNIQFSKSMGFELKAGRAHWNLFLNKELEGLGIFSDIKKRKYITGLLSLHDKRTDTFSVQYIVLTKPSNGDLEIMVVRSDGEVFYSGKATTSKGLMNFAIQDIERQGTAPTTVKGRLTTKGIQFEVCIPFGRRKGKRNPLPVTVAGTVHS